MRNKQKNQIYRIIITYNVTKGLSLNNNVDIIIKLIKFKKNKFKGNNLKIDFNKILIIDKIINLIINLMKELKFLILLSLIKYSLNIVRKMFIFNKN